MSEGYGLVGLDYWRLSDEFSVIDASFLTLNLDPGCFELEEPLRPAGSKIFKIAGFTENENRALWNGDIDKVELEPQQFRAVFKSLRNAILSNKIRANIVVSGRDPVFAKSEYGEVDVGAASGEQAMHYEYLVGHGRAGLFSSSAQFSVSSAKFGEPNWSDAVIYILTEPDWSETKLAIEDIKEWYSTRGVPSAFFFPSGIQDGFRDKTHRRYSAKLATAVAAWEAVKKAGKNKSPKQTLVECRFQFPGCGSGV